MNRAPAALLALLALALGGCGGSSGGQPAALPTGSSSSAQPGPTAPLPTSPAATTSAPPTPDQTASASSTVVGSYDSNGTQVTVSVEPDAAGAGVFCLVLAAGKESARQCGLAVPPPNQLKVISLQAGSVSTLAGVTSNAVAKVTAETDAASGLSTTPVPVPGASGKAFAMLDPGSVSQVVAYDDGGNVVARA